MSREDIGRVDFLYLKKLRKRVEEIGKNISRSKVSITDIALAETMDHLTPEQARGLKFRTVRPGRRWGRIWGTGWFRLRIVVPDEFDGKELFLIFDNGGECIIFDGSNMLGSLDRHHREQPIIRKARAGEKLELFIEAGANGPFGNFRGRTAGVPELAAVNRDVWDCYHDLKALLELLEVLDQNDTRAARIRFEMNKAVDLFDYSASDDRALAASARKVRRGVAGLLSRPANASAQTVACVGHAHIDVAWKWPLRETVRKCGRTFSNVLAYMDRYPDFIFCQSQPQLYEYTKKKYPDLYSRICRQVKAGRWVPVGGMWVEADCNLISGESMVRQLLFGTRFFEKEFGHRCRCLWLPDVFGYSAALPQILKRSGIDYFMTQKMSWNQFTRFPYHSFWWEGIDGSRVLTHFPPVDTYNGCLSAEELKNAESRYMEKDRSSIQLLPLGHGDGGGGPTMEMMERLKRYGDIEGLPKARPMAPNDFFRTLEKESDSFKKWVGELYLELHRGTLTTQAANKKNNRKSELLLRDTELISSVNCVAGESYPAKRLNAAWKTLLLNQFHDIIPGSSIREVYEDSDSDYERILSETEKIHSEAIVKFARGVDSKGDGRAVFVCNTLGWEREDVVSVKIRDLRRDRDYSAEFPDGSVRQAQLCNDGMLRFKAKVPSMGYTLCHVREGGNFVENRLTVKKQKLENDSLCVSLDKRARIVSIRDKVADREILPKRKTGNMFVLFEDKPAHWDAWDIDVFYKEKPLESDGALISVEPIENGPVRAVLRVKREISHSTVSQDIILYAGSRQLDFETTVHWGDEKDVLLKTAFPVEIRSDKARYEVQYGNLERPTHSNTVFDLAQFEVAAQRWADLSEADYGVALLNDCKYGHDIHDGVMSLSLLRSPKNPDTQADVNKTHRFTYSIYPHQGDYTNGVLQAGHGLNSPLQALHVLSSRGKKPPRDSWFEVTGNNVVIDAVKKAEDDNAVIVRLYEAHGCRGRRVLRTSLPFRKVQEVDLMEHPEKKVSFRDGKISFNLKPFQIRTFKFSRQ